MPKQPKPIANRIFALRRSAPLTQRELARLIGYNEDGTVGRHERSSALPPFLIALAYEVIFQVPVSELFFGLRDSVEQVVEQRILDLKQSLEQQDARGKYAARNARKLEWIATRRS